jgi:hypothetical protein
MILIFLLGAGTGAAPAVEFGVPVAASHGVDHHTCYHTFGGIAVTVVIETVGTAAAAVLVHAAGSAAGTVVVETVGTVGTVAATVVVDAAGTAAGAVVPGARLRGHGHHWYLEAQTVATSKWSEPRTRTITASHLAPHDIPAVAASHGVPSSYSVQSET